MIRHVVLMRWKERAEANRIRAAHERLATMPALVPGIERYEYGDDVGITDGAWDFALVADFASEEAYGVYANHPDHLAVIEEAIRPIAAETVRVQYRL